MEKKQLKKLTHQEILERKPSIESVKSLKRLPFCLVTDNIRSLYNIGSFFRTGDAVLIEKIYLCGPTSGYPPNKEIEKTALGATEIVPWEYYQSTVDCLKELKNKGYNVCALELTNQSKAYNAVQYQFPLALIVGNEVDGVSNETMNYVDEAIDIPMKGRANSLNVATAFAITAYEIFNQFNQNQNA